MRIVTYGYAKPDGDEGYCARDIFNASKMETLLVSAKSKGVIVEYDTGRGAIVWFQGRPGAQLRRLRSRVLKLLPADVEPWPFKRR